MPDHRQKIQIDHAEEAIGFCNPNFESLLKNARNPRLFPMVLDLLEGKQQGVQHISVTTSIWGSTTAVLLCA